jgi:transposase
VVVDVKTLPDNPQVLKETILEHQKIIDILNDEIAFYKNKLYGRKSEQYLGQDDKQGMLFNEAEMVCDLEKVPAHKERIEVPGYTRRKKGRRPLPASLPRQEIIIPIDEKDKICAAGKERMLIGYETSEKLEIKPPQLTVKVYKREI